MGKDTHKDENVSDQILVDSAADFSGPAPSLRFRLGSSIPIRATVEPRSRRSLRIYIKSCEFTTDADTSRATQVHPIIANAG